MALIGLGEVEEWFLDERVGSQLLQEAAIEFLFFYRMSCNASKQPEMVWRLEMMNRGLGKVIKRCLQGNGVWKTTLAKLRAPKKACLPPKGLLSVMWWWSPKQGCGWLGWKVIDGGWKLKVIVLQGSFSTIVTKPTNKKSTHTFKKLWTYSIFMIIRVKYILNFPRNHKLDMLGLWWKTFLLKL